MNPSDEHEKVLALDPGGTTGWATAVIDYRTLETIEAGQVRFEASGLWHFLEGFEPDYIVTESFTYRLGGRHGTDLTAVKWIGICELYCMQKDKRLRFQEPSIQGSKTAYWNTQKVKDVGLWLPNHPHAMSATKHLLYFLTFKKGSTLWDAARNPLLQPYAPQQ